MDEDVFQSFIPFSKKRNAKMSFTQSSQVSTRRLPLSLRQKSGKRWINSKRPATATSIDTTLDGLQERAAATSIGYCPVCQVPFAFLKVLPGIHATTCNVNWNQLQECELGEDCDVTSVFHYRDYSHQKLANRRASKKNEPQDSHKEGSAFPVHKPCKRGSNMSSLESESSTSDMTWGSPVHKFHCSKQHLPEAPLETFKKKQCNSQDLGKGISYANNSKKEVVTNFPNASDCDYVISRSDVYKKQFLQPSKLSESSHSITKVNQESEISCGKNPKSLAFRGNIIYKGKEKYSLSKNKCIRTNTISCNGCTCQKNVEGSGSVDNDIETSVEMKLSSPDKNDIPSVETPVKVNLKYSELGWQTVGVDVQSQTGIEEVAVAVCDCLHCLEMKCTVADVDKEALHEKNADKSHCKLLINLEDLGSCRSDGSMKSKDLNMVKTRQMSIISNFEPNGGSSTRLELSASQKESVCSAAKDEIGVGSSHTEPLSALFLASADASLSSNKNEAAREKWKGLLHHMQSRGFSTMSVMSNDSLDSASSTKECFTGNKNFKERKTVKQCPFYKKIPDTSFVVDAFQYGIIPGVTHYFLTHFHADHYIGLLKSFNKPIICSAVTARLVKKKIGVDPCYLNVIELESSVVIQQVTVTALDANHCPGSLMFLFQLLDGRNFLHVGDFRADPFMESYPCFWNLNIDKLFLDTTYCDPKYTFPTQADIIGKVVGITKRHLQKKPSTLIVSGTYTIGKEKVFMGIAEKFDFKIWAKKEKRLVLNCLDDENLKKRLVDYPWEAQLHVWSMMDFDIISLRTHLSECKGKFQEVLAFKPSGWELRGQGNQEDFTNYSRDNVTVYCVPYSEHSSFTEMQRFVQFLKPMEIIPTVNVGKPATRAAMQRIFKEWLSGQQTVSQKDNKKQLKISSYFHHET